MSKEECTQFQFNLSHARHGVMTGIKTCWINILAETPTAWLVLSGVSFCNVISSKHVRTRPQRQFQWAYKHCVWSRNPTNPTLLKWPNLLKNASTILRKLDQKSWGRHSIAELSQSNSSLHSCKWYCFQCASESYLPWHSTQAKLSSE